MSPVKPRVYIGYDAREHAAYEVAERSLLAHSPDAQVTRLDATRLADQGLLRRPQDRRGNSTYDIISNAPQSTDFAISRFLVPHLAHEGWALFVDCDVVFLRPIEELFALADDRCAAMVVKHAALAESGLKMDGQAQTPYPRKNWSSVVLWNCDHPANRRLSLQDVNERPGRDLHAFYYLHDEEIGGLPRGWNWLVNVQPKPENTGIAHLTLGGPWLPNWAPAAHDDIWLQWCHTRAKEGAPDGQPS